MNYNFIKGKTNVFFLFIFLTCFSATVTAQDSLHIKKHTYTSNKFERKMHKKNVQVLDVRTEAEYKEGHLPNALLIDVQQDDFMEKIGSLDKHKTYLIYCKSGRRSAKALQLLYNAGFSNVYHLKGGFLNWKGKKEK